MVPAQMQSDAVPSPAAVPSVGSDPTAPISGLTPDPSNDTATSDAFDWHGSAHVALIYPEPVNYQNGSGAWVPIQPQLVSDGSGGYGNKAGPFKLDFPANWSGGSPVTFVQGAYGVSISVVGGAASSPTLGSDGQSVTYPSVLPSVDVGFVSTTTGYQDHVLLKDSSAPAGITYAVSVNGGISLALQADGSIGVLDKHGNLVDTLPVPTATASNIDPTTGVAATTHGTYTLSGGSGGSYQLGVSFDPSWLATVQYPVAVDPSVTGIHPTMDAYTDQNNPGTNYNNNQLLVKADTRSGGDTQHSLVRFDLGNYFQSGRIAEPGTYIQMLSSSVGDSSEPVTVKQITSSWNESSVDWTNEPTATSTDSANATVGQASWFTWTPLNMVTTMLQTGSFYGFKFTIGGEAQNNQVAFVSSNVSTQSEWPVMRLVYDDPPSTLQLSAPTNNDVLDYQSPTLSVTGPASDIDSNDTVTTEYQVTATQTNGQPDFSNGKLVADSGTLSNGSNWTVPAGELLDGQQYWWRALASDGTESTPSGTTRSFKVLLPHYGTDSRWPMWNDQLGNGMQVSVNEATGNLYLDYPLDSISSPNGSLDVSLGYNSLDQTSIGLGRGWVVSAGPGSDPHHLPISMTPNDDSGNELQLTLADGTKVAFAKQPGGSATETSYTATGAMAGTVYMDNGSGTTTYTYESLDGGRYLFDANGNLTTASPATTNDGGGGFTYTFGTGGRISSVTLPENRSVTFGYDASNNLNQIQLLSGSTVLRTWTPSVGANGLTSVQDPLGHSVSFGYASQSDGYTYLTSVTDGTNHTWNLGYTNPGSLNLPIPNGATDSGPQMQVASVQDPGTYETTAGDPNSAPTSRIPATTFAYGAQLEGRVMTSVTITDPRGNASGATAANYQTTTLFDTMGFPIRITGPPNPALGSPPNNQPITTMVWDTNGNLLCKRLPPANAIAPDCEATKNTSGTRETDYTYQGSAPYQVTSVTGPAPNPDATGTRAVTTYNYEEGIGGLLQENYQSISFQGVPLFRQAGVNATDNWGTSPPHSLSNSTNWAIRWVGRLNAPTGGPYQFKLYAQGVVRLIVDGQVLEDCWGSAKKAFATYNCGSSTPDTLSLSAGWHSFLVEYKHFSTDNTANIDLQWDGGNGGSFVSMPANVFDPKLDALTSTVAPSGMTTTYSYGSATEVRGIPTEIDTANSSGSVVRTEALTYDDWGRPLTESYASGQSGAYTITNTYDSGGNPCLSQTTVSQSGEVDHTTTNVCNASGDVTSSTVSVPAVSGTQQASADQTTTTGYNALGQVTSVQQTGNANATTTTYNADGKTQNVTDPLGNKTSYTYQPNGLVATETDNATGPASAQEQSRYGYDAAGNQIDTTKQYGGGTSYSWTSAYDAENRLSSTQTPGVTNPTTYIYDATSTQPAGQTGYTYLTTQVTDPAGVQTTTTQDMTGAVVATQVATQATHPQNPTLYQYNTSGQLTQTTDPNGIVTSESYNVFGDEASSTEPSGPSGANETTTYAYDPVGHLSSVTDPYGNATNYVEDASGNPLSVTLSGAASATTFTYDGAGQRVSVVDPDGRHRDFTYDQLGNLSAKYEYPQGGSKVDPSNTWLTTTYGYDQNSELTSASRPTGRKQCFTYDAYGNMASRYTVATTATCPGGTQQDVQTYTYNPLSGMTSAADTSGGQPTVSVTYDPANPTRVQSVSEGSGSSTTYAYSGANGRLSSTADAVGSHTNTTQYGYDAQGRISSVTNPFTNQATTYTYSGTNQTGSQLASRSDPNGMITNYIYDADGRLSTQTSTSGSATMSFTLGYNNVSRITSLSGTYPTASGSTNPGAGSWTYTYYGNGELKTAQLGSNAKTTYNYDGAGNRTDVIVGTNDTVSTYDGAGRLTGVAGTSYVWNGDDQLTNAGSTVYGYDNWGRELTATVGSNPKITYAYDALDRTLTRSPATGSASNYTYTGTSQTLSSATTGSANPVYYAWGGDGPLAQQQGSATRFLIADPHSNLAGFFDTTGTATGTISYDPWGNPSAVGSDATASLLGYQSQPTDPTTGLTDMGARNYDPSQGRFTTEDTVFGNPSDPLSLNQYTYGQDSPVDNTDPTGNMIYCGAGCTHADQEIARTYSAIAIGHATGARVSSAWTQQLAYENSHYNQINRDWAAQVAASKYLAARAQAAKLAAEAQQRPKPKCYGRGCEAAGMGRYPFGRHGSATDLMAGATVFSAFVPVGDIADAFGGLAGRVFGGDGSAAVADDAGSALFEPGPYARESIPARGPGPANAAEQRSLNELGDQYGCHSCGASEPGTSSGNWVGDHQPISRWANGRGQNLYPQCLSCSNQQGLDVINALRHGYNPYE